MPLHAHAHGDIPYEATPPLQLLFSTMLKIQLWLFTGAKGTFRKLHCLISGFDTCRAYFWVVIARHHGTSRIPSEENRSPFHWLQRKQIRTMFDYIWKSPIKLQYAIDAKVSRCKVRILATKLQYTHYSNNFRGCKISTSHILSVTALRDIRKCPKNPFFWYTCGSACLVISAN